MGHIVMRAGVASTCFRLYQYVKNTWLLMSFKDKISSIRLAPEPFSGDHGQVVRIQLNRPRRDLCLLPILCDSDATSSAGIHESFSSTVHPHLSTNKAIVPHYKSLKLRFTKLYADH
jgi:hypothetical protein